MFPVEVSCSHCGASLLDPDHPIEGFPAVHVTVRFHGKKGDLWLSSLYGSYRGRQELEVPKGAEVELLCPSCSDVLSDGPPCPACNARTVTLEMARGGMVRFCSRYGCRKHAIAFSDLGNVVIASIMNRYIVSVYGTDTLLTAAETLVNYEISGVPVLDEKENLLGLLTEDRILEMSYPESFQRSTSRTTPILKTPADWQKVTCAEVAIRKPVCVEPDLPLVEAGAIMTRKKIGLLLVVKDGTLVGLLSKGDLFRALLREKIG